jgi:hypothetical protein
MASLYELTGERLALEQKLRSLDLDEVTIQDTLSGSSKDIERKIEDYGYVIRNLRAPALAIDEEIKRLQDRKKAIEKRADKVEYWLFHNMETAGISRVECPLFTIALQDNPPSVDVFDESLLPAEFLRHPAPPPPAPDKKAIAAAIKAGQEVPGAVLKQGKRLVIK